MDTLTISERHIYLLIGNHITAPMLELSAHIAAQGPVRILDGSNSSNVRYIANSLRRMTPEIYPALERVYLARAFTCYEMVTLIKRTLADGIPTLLPGLLSTFYDEDVPLIESQRLLKLSLKNLRDLCVSQPIVISARPPNQRIADRKILLEMVTDYADRTMSLQDAPEAHKVETQLRLPF
jgi:hypothetical protein